MIKLRASVEAKSMGYTLQLSFLKQHLQVSVQLLAPLFDKVRRGIVVEQALWGQLQPVCWHLH